VTTPAASRRDLLQNGLPHPRTVRVIATDGGPMAAPQTVTQRTVGIAERYGLGNDHDHTVTESVVTGPATEDTDDAVPAVPGRVRRSVLDGLVVLGVLAWALWLIGA
jgi:hypothetical protein